ncbi:MAG: DcuS/MalK family sensor histidine kinase [Spirochaetes bacterium]|nr:DcuS/MalK family sensor histidine kinase [Spirochaetota bacterium]
MGNRISSMTLSLQLRITIVVSFIILIALGLETLLIKRSFESYIVTQTENRVLSIATQVAQDPEIIEAFHLPDPSKRIQPIAEKVRMMTGTSYVVVFNMDTIRYSHPVPERIGQHFVGGDEQDSLKGKRYVSQAHGTLGLSIRAFVPIFDASSTQIGVVSVGQLLRDVEMESRRLTSILSVALGLSLFVGAVGAFLLSRSIKKILFGLEPQEIATLLEERNVILSSIKEGVLAVDRDARVILINENAKALLGLRDVPEKCRVQDLIPTSKLPKVIRSREPDYDEEQIVNHRVLLVNRVPMVSKGEVIGAVATFRDMSEIRSMAEELTSVKQYVEGLRAQHHEFLNRLHVIAGLLQLKEYRKAVDFVLDTVSKDQEVLDYLKTHVQEPTISGLLLAKITSAREQNIEIEFPSEARFPPIRKEVVGSLVTVLGNLIQNAIEALRESGRVPKKIGILFSLSENQFTIRIQDTGLGVSQEAKDRIFQKGFTTKKEGKGMGLFLVRQQVEGLGGSVAFESSEQGTVFTVVLPKERVCL